MLTAHRLRSTAVASRLKAESNIMIRTIEAIGITRAFAQDSYEIDPSDPHFDFYLRTAARNVSMQSEHLENVSRALVLEAEQLKTDVETRLKS